MKIIADLHTHTTASTHAYSSMKEMIDSARNKGLKAIAITDHGISMPGAPGKWYFDNLNAVPQYVDNVMVLRGQETNVIDIEGNIDIEDSCKNILNWVVASIHRPCFKNKKHTTEDITNLWLNVAEQSKVNVIGHCGTFDFGFDYETVIKVFGKKNKLVELNEGTFRNRKSSIPNCVEIMKLCKKFSVPIVVDSDSHFYTQVGTFPNSMKLLEELNFPEELVVNSSWERLYKYLKENNCLNF